MVKSGRHCKCNPTDLELLLYSSESLEQNVCLPITCHKSFSMPIYDGRKYEALHLLSDTFEMVWYTDESLHFSKVLGLHFF